MKHKTNLTFLVIIILTLGCRKDINVPIPEQEKLFGTWDWVQSVGGFSGSSLDNPSTCNCNKTVEYNKNGIYKACKDGHQTQKMKFTFSSTVKTSQIYGNIYQINFEEEGLFHKDDNYSTTISFGGQDTLFMDVINYDGLVSTYVRKK
jgi:hypothetical protein